MDTFNALIRKVFDGISHKDMLDILQNRSNIADLHAHLDDIEECADAFLANDAQSLKNSNSSELIDEFQEY